MRDDSPYYRHVYGPEEVARLLGLREGWGRQGIRHVTIVDLLSWAKDPGGTDLWYSLTVGSSPREAWMAQRGPLPPDSELGAVLWDTLRAVNELPLRDQVIVALTAFGFTQREIAEVLHVGKSEVFRALWGDEGRQIEGAVVKITRSMNGSTNGSTTSTKAPA